MITILLVDDHPAVRRALRLRLSLEPDLAVVGEAPDGVAGLALAQELCPDVVLLDARMARLDGLRATRAVRQRVPHSRVVLLSLYDDARARQRAMAAGAAAFLSKYEVESEELPLLVRRVVRADGAPWVLRRDAAGWDADRVKSE